MDGVIPVTSPSKRLLACVKCGIVVNSKLEVSISNPFYCKVCKPLVANNIKILKGLAEKLARSR
jgi:hypothetical protein